MRIARLLVVGSLLLGSVCGRADDNNRFTEYWRANGVPILTAIGIVGVALVVHHGLPQRIVKAGVARDVHTETIVEELPDPRNVLIRTPLWNEPRHARVSDLEIPSSALGQQAHQYEMNGQAYLIQHDPEAPNTYALELVRINDQITEPTAKPGTYWAEHTWTPEHAQLRNLAPVEPEVVSPTETESIPPAAL